MLLAIAVLLLDGNSDSSPRRTFALATGAVGAVAMTVSNKLNLLTCTYTL